MRGAEEEGAPGEENTLNDGNGFSTLSSRAERGISLASHRDRGSRSLAALGMTVRTFVMTVRSLGMTLRSLGPLLPGLALIAASACTAPETPSAPLRVVLAPDGPNTRLTLLAPPGAKVNARLAPALELPDGTVLRFAAGRLTADSAYFAEPPTSHLPGRHDRIHGTLRASVCGADELVCRTVSLEL